MVLTSQYLRIALVCVRLDDGIVGHGRSVQQPGEEVELHELLQRRIEPEPHRILDFLVVSPFPRSLLCSCHVGDSTRDPAGFEVDAGWQGRLTTAG